MLPQKVNFVKTEISCLFDWRWKKVWNIRGRKGGAAHFQTLKAKKWGTRDQRAVIRLINSLAGSKTQERASA